MSNKALRKLARLADAEAQEHLNQRVTVAILAAEAADRAAVAAWEAVERAEAALAACASLPDVDRRLAETGVVMARARARLFRATPDKSQRDRAFPPDAGEF